MTVHNITLAGEGNWHQEVARVYAEIVADADPTIGIGRQEAFNLALDRIARMVESGEISVNLTDSIRAALSQADDTHGRQADAIIRRVARGEMPLELDSGELDVVVVLGSGRRKVWRHVTEDDLREMDSIRYRNFRNAAESYDVWRESFEVVLPAVHQHGTVGAAVAAGIDLGEAAS